jgi:hypothetical protein
MTEPVSWSLTAGGASGAGVNAAGQTAGDATVSASLTLEAQTDPRDLALQIDDVAKVTFLAISSTLTDGSVGVRAGPGDFTALTGPILLFGGAVGLFAADLSTLTVQNTSATDTADLTVLIGLTL